MAIFKNKDKGRPWESPQQKRERKEREDYLFEEERSANQIRVWLKMGCSNFDYFDPRAEICHQPGPAYCAAVERPEAIEKCPKDFSILTPNRRMIMKPVCPLDSEVIPITEEELRSRALFMAKLRKMGIISDLSLPRPEEKSILAEFFGTKLYRVQKWLAGFWADASFQKAGAWMPADRRGL